MCGSEASGTKVNSASAPQTAVADRQTVADLQSVSATLYQSFSLLTFVMVLQPLPVQAAVQGCLTKQTSAI